MKDKLKPCPFCGKTVNLCVVEVEVPSFNEPIRAYAVECNVWPDGSYDGCGMRGPWASTKRGAIANHNRRAK